MFGIDPGFLVTIAALPAAMIWFALVRAARSKRRNRDDRCGNCGGSLYAAHANAGPSLVQGHLVCGLCAAKERRSLIRSLVAAAGITGATALGLASVALWFPTQLGAHPWTPVLATVLGYPALFAGAVVWMKRANRRTAQRLGLERQLSVSATNDPLLPVERRSWTIRHTQTPDER